MPEFTDLFGVQAQLSLNLESANMVFNFDNKLGIISLKNDDSSLLFQFPGQYVIKYSLVDKFTNQKSYSFTIYVTCFNVESIKKPTLVPYRPIIEVDNPPKPFIESIDQIGKVRIAFTQEIQIITFDLYPEFRGSDMMRAELNTSL